ncbi:MAG: universal stress protein [Pseudobdellovibrionaceae bacterium]|nr:universal stress protein [Bdellovibrionales bacterium]USN48409.1 MAG: universal stress protein [Pseudobdellovibrionaceae bacterium]
MAKQKQLTAGSIIWAVDPAAEDPKVNQKVAGALETLASQTGLEIKPVTVITERQNELLVHMLERAELWSYESAIPDMVMALIKKLKLKNIKAPVVLTSKDSGRRNAVKKLVDFAKKQKASMIVVGSHSRKGLSKLFLGSFAETLCQSSTVPILVVNPKTASPSEFKNILFATDFSEPSVNSFKNILPMVKKMRGKVTILHQVEFPLIPISEYEQFRSPSGEVMAKEYAKRQKKLFGAKMKRLQDLAKAAGVPAKVMIEDKMQAVSDSIVQFANQQKMDVIVLPTQSGPVSSVLLGSVAQQVLRSSEIPVWIAQASK